MVRFSGSLRMEEWRDRQFVVAFALEWRGIGVQVLRFMDGIIGEHAFSYTAWAFGRRWRKTNIPLRA